MFQINLDDGQSMEVNTTGTGSVKVIHIITIG